MLWLQDAVLQNPDEMQVDGDRPVIAPWGKDLQDDFTTKTLRHLIAVDLASKAISIIVAATGFRILCKGTM